MGLAPKTPPSVKTATPNIASRYKTERENTETLMDMGERGAAGSQRYRYLLKVRSRRPRCIDGIDGLQTVFPSYMQHIDPLVGSTT